MTAELVKLTRRNLLILGGVGTLALGASSLQAATPKQQFASLRFRSPTDIGKVRREMEFMAAKFYFTSPDYPVSNLRFAFPAYYVNVRNKGISEQPAPNPFTIDGFAVGVYDQFGDCTHYTGTFAGEETVLVDPAVNDVGLLSDPLVPTQIPPNSLLQLVVAFHVEPGQSMLTGLATRTGLGEGQYGAATNVKAHKLNDTNKFGNRGAVNGRSYGPAYMTAEGGDGRPVFVIVGDSIGYGERETILNANEQGNWGYVSRGLDDTGSLRMAGANLCIPGTGPEEKADRATWRRQLDLVRLLPEPPFTDIICQHGTNSVGSDTEQFISVMTRFWTTVKEEWPGIPLHQCSLLPRPETTDGTTSLEGQSVIASNDLGGTRWVFNDMLESGAFSGMIDSVIRTWEEYSYDTGENRKFVHTLPYRAQLAADIPEGSKTLPLTVAPESGDLLVIGPGTVNVITAVTDIAGTGPFEVNVVNGKIPALPAGTEVRASLIGDEASGRALHPSTAGHKLIAQSVVNWKRARFL